MHIHSVCKAGNFNTKLFQIGIVVYFKQQHQRVSLLENARVYQYVKSGEAILSSENVN
jgi:hypothetical protein